MICKADTSFFVSVLAVINKADYTNPRWCAPFVYRLGH